MKRLHGPPAPNPIVTRLRDQLESAHDPADVVAAALGLRDATAPILPLGGGFAVGNRARVYADDVVAALDRRGLLTRQGVLL